MQNLKLRKFILKAFWSIIRQFAARKISRYTVLFMAAVHEYVSSCWNSNKYYVVDHSMLSKEVVHFSIYSFNNSCLRAQPVL